MKTRCGSAEGSSKVVRQVTDGEVDAKQNQFWSGHVPDGVVELLSEQQREVTVSIRMNGTPDFIL